jgi:hypothetical protein
MKGIASTGAPKTLLDGWVDGWVGGKAGLRVAYSNQQKNPFGHVKTVLRENQTFPNQV